MTFQAPNEVNFATFSVPKEYCFSISAVLSRGDRVKHLNMAGNIVFPNCCFFQTVVQPTAAESVALRDQTYQENQHLDRYKWRQTYLAII